MHTYDVREVLYLNCEIRGSWIRGSAIREGQLLPFYKHILYLRKSLLTSTEVGDKPNYDTIDHEAFYKNCDIPSRWVRSSNAWAG